VNTHPARNITNDRIDLLGNIHDYL